MSPSKPVRVSGTKNLPLLGTADPREIVTELAPDAVVVLPVILADSVVAFVHRPSGTDRTKAD